MKMTRKDFQALTAFVHQTDALMATETPREALEFAAHMRISSKVPKIQKDEIVENMINSLSIQDCAGTMIGSQTVKGISGGQKRRVSIGVELISDPPIIFLDEPTSGLDSLSALSITQMIKEFAKSGKVVIMVIHQPSTEIFNLIDDLLLVANGHVIAHGPMKSVAKQFEAIGHPCPPQTNPADHYILQISQQEQYNKLLLAKKETAGESLENSWKRRDVTQTTLDEMFQESIDAVLRERKDRGGKARFCEQLRFLMKRNVHYYTRDLTYILTTVLIAIALSNFGGTFFQDQAGRLDLDQMSTMKYGDEGQEENNIILKATGNSFWFITMAIFNAGLNRINNAADEKPMFLREYHSGYYGVTAYFLSKYLVYLPINILISTIYWLCMHFWVGYQGNIWIYLLAAYALHDCGAAHGLSIGLNSKSAAVAIQYLPFAVLAETYLTGFWCDTPFFWRPFKWATGLYYGQFACFLNEYGQHKIDGNHGWTAVAFVKFDVFPDDPFTSIVFHIGILFLLSAVMRVCGALLLWFRLRRKD